MSYYKDPHEWEEDDDRPVDAPVKLVGEILYETPKAILFKVNGTTGINAKGSWFPLSQCVKIVRTPAPKFEGSETREQLEDWEPKDEIHIAAWLAKKKGV